MLPRYPMLTIKNWRASPGVLLVCWATLLAGCTPAGPRALLDGERLIREEKYPQAIRRLEAATKALPANAQAWNHLGLAYHKAGQPDAALQAYEQARHIDINLTSVRYNLGCLLLEQNNPQAATAELTAYTLLERNSVDGWLKLASAQLRSRQFENAERSYQTALQLRPNSAEAWNGLGVIHLQRRRPKEALNAFNVALQKQPDFPPAILNSAVLHHHYLNNRPLALERYQEFLQLQPTAPEAAEVLNTVRQLRADLAPVPRPEPTNVVRAPIVPPPASAEAPAAPHVNTNAVVASRNPVTPSPTPPPTTTIVPRTRSVASNPAPSPEATRNSRNTPEAPRKQESAPPPVLTPPPPASAVVKTPVNPAPENPTPATPTSATSKMEVVRLDDEPQPKLAQDAPQSVPVEPPPTAPVQPDTSNSRDVAAFEAPPAVLDADGRPEKRSVVERLNPATWFRKRRVTTPTPLAPIAEPRPNPHEDPRLVTSRLLVNHTPPPPPLRRYSYRSPQMPAPGNRTEAETYFSRALQEHRERRLPEAILDYRQAIARDPSYFEAYYNLGLASFDLKDLPVSLSAYETALSINSTSANGRYNFALALQTAGYFVDAASEYERVLEQHPGEARAHLSLASIYAGKLNRPDLARTHYRRVLQLEPDHPEASEIRFWLAANP